MAARKAKTFPVMPRAPVLAALMQSCAFILVANWACQGMRGMQSKELSFRLALEALLWITLVRLGLHPLGALFLAHSFGFLFNGQLWVCVRYCPLYHGDRDRLDAFLRVTARRLRRTPWLQEAVCIGSRGRGTAAWGPRSDLDLRLVFPPGVRGWLRTNLLLLKLRTRALLMAVPLDLYAYDGPEALARFDQREPLLLVLDRAGRIRERFAARELREHR
ncbi:MAG TPA: hypothetical protein VFG43_02570 [Geminicoccaceae bacterium]|nr:hypothetical protein [Geminicoccaceae bacterium]